MRMMRLCFSLCVAVMLNEIPPTSAGVNLRYCMDEGVFNLAHVRAESTITAHELQFADDNTTSAQTMDDLHRITTIYNVSYKPFGIEINTDNTQVLQPPPGQTS